jgi:hypothetical protein
MRGTYTGNGKKCKTVDDSRVTLKPWYEDLHPVDTVTLKEVKSVSHALVKSSKKEKKKDDLLALIKKFEMGRLL